MTFQPETPLIFTCFYVTGDQFILRDATGGWNASHRSQGLTSNVTVWSRISQSYLTFMRSVKASDFSLEILLFKILGLQINFLCCTAMGEMIPIFKKMGIRKRVKYNWGRVQRQQVEKVSRVKTESSSVRMGEDILFWCEHDSRHLIKIWCDEYIKQDAFLS